MSAPRIVFLAGPSGAGRSQAVKTFEDLGFYCVEHLPPAALEATLDALDSAGVSEIVITLDVHGEAPLGDALTVIAAARAKYDVTLLYLDARDETLVRRFSETRRRHPLAGIGSLRDAITAERAILLPLRERADSVIDTTQVTHGALKERLAAAFAPGERAILSVAIVPFGFKYGLPLDLDLLFDVRFLRNPNYEDDLRPLTGDDPRVAAFIETDSNCAPFFAHLFGLVEFLVPQYIAEGKAQLTIGVGCTGGRHRSVYAANRLHDRLARDAGLAIAIDARDVVR